MATRTKRRVDRIRADIPIAQLLSDFGYDVRADGGDREQQFPCDLHGDGHDNKPSARVYPVTAQWYCFACDRSRDAIETVKSKKGLKFGEALTFLEQKYNLKPLPWEEGDDKPMSVSEEIRRILKPDKTFADDIARLKAALDGITIDREFLMDDVLVFWEAHDHLVWLMEKGKITEYKARAVVLEIEHRLAKMLNDGTRHE